MWSFLFVAVLSALISPVFSNNKPIFVEDLKTKLETEGISENVQKGTVVGYLSCTDRDGDRIEYSSTDVRYLAVDSVSGKVVVNGNLDKEETSNSQGGGNKPYLVQFRCRDLGADGSYKSDVISDVTITVQDENDETPTFSTDSEQGYRFYVSEAEKPGYVLEGSVNVTDKDQENTNVQLQRVDLVCEDDTPEACQLFSLRYSSTGFGKYTIRIILEGHLDFETEEVYNTGIIAVDGVPGMSDVNTGSVGIQIRVTDSQDTDPQFVNSVDYFNVQEGHEVNTAVNFQMSARDMDKNNWRDLTFEILDKGANEANLFKAGNAVKGEGGMFSAPVIVRSPIDRETTSDVYSFTAKVTELDSNGVRTDATATAVFTVRINDVNDNAPQFTSEIYSVTMREATSTVVNQTVVVDNLQVNDPDRQDNAKYKVEIVSQTFSGAFGVTPNFEVAGSQAFHLVVNNYQLVDYDKEDYRSQVVVLRAVETQTSERLSSTATVSITLTDVNDHDPEFEREIYEGSILENAASGTTILTVKATDDDTGINGEVVYRISTTDDEMFQVDRVTGVISLKGQLNYETKRTYTVTVYADDKGAEPKSTQASVIIRVINYNEVGPRFTSEQYRAQVTEGSTEFLDPVRVEAIDSSDTSVNITYRIVDGNTPTNSFLLNPFTGELTLKERVMFGMTPNISGYFVLTVEATDNGIPPLSAQTFITVEVLDENDNAPIFNPTEYRKTISEAISEDEFLLQVYATDADYGSNGKITYRIGRGGRDSFNVREDGRVFTSSSPTLDYDLYESLTVEIIATDGGSPQQSATATMYITVTDANNKPPVFAPRTYNSIIDEATPKGTAVLTVTATDPDSGHILFYSLVKDSIQTVNKAGVEVYSSRYDTKSVFDVNSQTGTITVATYGPGLDRSYVANMFFQVMVEDTNAPTRQADTAYVTITIVGKPETELYFNRPWTKDKPEYSLFISESSAIGTEIKTLQARDPAKSGTVVKNYEEVPGTDVEDYFALSAATPGMVILNRALDYESGKLRHSVVIRATEPATADLASRTATATIIVDVQDANDNPPFFTRQDYEYTISESVNVNYEVGRITAYDVDSPSFGPIEFIMGIGQDRDDFRLNTTNSPNTVRLVVNRKLDFERRSSYSLEVIAKDNKNKAGSSLRLESKARIKINLRDENDNTPTFSDKKRSFSVPETAEINTRLGQVLARDDDTGLFGEIIYSIERDDNAPPSPADPLFLFGITQASGVLVTKQLLRGLKGDYNVLVVARDRGTNPRSSSIPVEIKVQGVEDDDGTPKWVSPSRFVVYVTEHNVTKLDVELKAVPRTPNAQITYSLASFEDDYQSFRIDSVTGDIFVIADLDREDQETYTLLVEATDTLDPSKLSRRELTVHLIDIDDNDPSFQKSNYSACPNDFEVPTEFTTPDNTPAFTIVGYVEACDPDGPGNNEKYYYRYTGTKLCLETADNALRVNVNGSVESTEMLDYEKKKEYLVCVIVESFLRPPGQRRKRAFDKSQMTQTDKIAYIVVSIIDVNDNGPRFEDEAIMEVLETLPSEDTVVQVLADDPDGPLNNRVIYTIKEILYYPPNGAPPFSMRGAFTINPDNGVIMASLPSYQDFAYGYFELEIEAFDYQNRQFNDSVTVTFVVHQRSQILRVVLDQEPDEGQVVANNLIRALNDIGKEDGVQFFLIKTSEHRTESTIVPTQMDVCFVIVENKKAYDVSRGMELLDSAKYRDELETFKMVDRGTCYPLTSSKDDVKWEDLWWVLVAIAAFIFICCIILIITVVILYDRYKNYMDTQKTYLVPQ